MVSIQSLALRERVLAGSLRTAAAALRLGIALHPAAPAQRGLDRVSFDEAGVLRCLAEGGHEYVGWAELAEVGLLSLDEDHWVDSLCWILVSLDRKRGCAVPWGAAGAAPLTERLRRLPGFDEAALARALECPHAARFVCWRRTGPARPRLVDRVVLRT